MAGALALPVAAYARADDPVERAIAAAGGRALLERVEALNWTALLTMHNDGTSVAANSIARFEPFVSISFENRFVGKDRSSAEKVAFDLTRPADTSGKEQFRQQSAVLGYLLMVDAPIRPGEGGSLMAERENMPAFTFTLGSDGLIREGRYRAMRLDGAGFSTRQLRFERHLTAQGLVWPSKIIITEDGQPYLDYEFRTLSVELA